MDINVQCNLQNQLNRWQFFAPCPGANVTIIDSKQGNWSGASGYSDVDTVDAMQVGARCYIYSITKTFTAIRVLQLVEQGAVSLDETITRYLPDLDLPAEVTVRRLLNHSSGIPSYTDFPDYLPDNLASPGKPWSYQHVLQKISDTPMDFSAGAGWHYSNSGYMMLHKMIETVTGQSFAENIEQGIVAPLGLQQTTVATEIDTGSLVPGYCPYLNDQQTMENVMQIYHPGWCLTGLVASTTSEVAELYRALFNGLLVDRGMLTEMITPVSCGSDESHPFFRNPGYGLGIMTDTQWGYGGLYGHGGDGPGFNTWAMVLPDFHGRQLVMVIFCNASIGAHPFRLCRNLLRVLEQES